MTVLRMVLLQICLMALMGSWKMVCADLPSIQQSGELRVGTTGDYAPYSIWNEQTRAYSGSDIEAAQRLAKYLGVKLRFVATSWPTLATDLEQGRFDIAMSGITRTPERQALGLFSLPYQTSGKVPLVRCEDANRLTSLQQIDQPGVRVIENPGGTNERFARQRLQKARLLIHTDNRTVFDALLDDQADVMFTDVEEAMLQHREHPRLCAIHPEKPLTHEVKAYWMPKDNPDLQRRVNQWLRKIK